LPIFPPFLSPVKPVQRLTLGCSALAAMLLFSGCTVFSGDSVDYKGAAAKTRPLDVPPDLTQLARDGRFQQSGGVVSAAAAAAAQQQAGATPGAAANATVAVRAAADIRIERRGTQRWLVVDRAPEALWPQLREFWERNGFTLNLDNASAGLMETNWRENRAKLPNDPIRNTLGRVLGNLWDTGERDLFRTRVERAETGSEIFISHRGIAEQFTGPQRDQTVWRPRPSDTELEAEMLSRLMVALAPVAGAPTAAPAAAPTAPTAAGTPPAVTAARSAVNAAPDAPPRARLVDNGTALEVDEGFDRAWRRVGLALDRGGFTVEDRDRANGIYYVRYINPELAGREEPNFFQRLFGAEAAQVALRYRVTLTRETGKSTIRVLTSAGTAEAGENGRRIVAQLVNELR
jgi:outer membrane protein assembly factor BamC